MTDSQAPISLSVIVCCYNVEHYLDSSFPCLEKQWGERTDYEIILVNDGSTDGTINKLNEFKSRHPDHVKVIDKQKNAGLAAARNSALDIARGTWIGFYDPDDLLAEGSYYRLLELIENSDGDFEMLRFGVKSVDSDEVHTSPLVEPLTIEWRGTSVDYMLETNFGTCWCYLYRRELLSNRRFPTNMIVEDLLFLVPVLLEGRKMARTEAIVYYYIVRTDSATFVSSNYKRLDKQSSDIANGIKMLEEFKQGQSENIKSRLLEKQRLLVHNMSTRMLLSNKSVRDVKDIVQDMTQLKLYPLPSGGMMVRLMNFVFSHLWALLIFRPVYRLFHRVKNFIRY